MLTDGIKGKQAEKDDRENGGKNMSGRVNV
jgi:hypothetical protein